MTLAIARLEASWSSGQMQSGTAFAISPALALTALHCVRSPEAGEVAPDLVRLHFQDGFVDATVETGDVLADFAVLRLRAPLPAGILPVQIVAECQPREQWYSMGYPVAVPDVDGYAFTGSVTNPSARIRVPDPVLDADGPGRWAPAIQLQCEQAAARLPLRGASGAPILVGGTSLAAGIVRWNPPLEEGADGEFLAAGGAVFACPVSLAAARHEEVGRLLNPVHRPAFGRDKATEKALMDQLPVSRKGRLGVLSGALVAGIVALVVLATGGSVAAGYGAVQALGGGTGAATVEPAAGVTFGPDAAATSPATASPTAAAPTTTPAATGSTGRPRPVPPADTTGPRPENPTCPPSISVSPAGGPVGTALTIRGSCFRPGEVVRIRFHTNTISQPVASAQGSFTAAGTVPASYGWAAPEQFTVVATGKESIRSDSQPFELAESPDNPPQPPLKPSSTPTPTPTEAPATSPPDLPDGD